MNRKGSALVAFFLIFAFGEVGWADSGSPTPPPLREPPGGVEPPARVDYLVNLASDEMDADGGLDGRCDINPSQTGDQCTLRAAIQQANASFISDHVQRTIGFAGQITTIVVPRGNPLPYLYTPTNIRGRVDAYGLPEIVIDAMGGEFVFVVQTIGMTESMNISGIRFSGASGSGMSAGSVIFNIDNDLYLSRSVVSQNISTRAGGLLIMGNGKVWIRDSRITDNQATITNGGGIYVDGNVELTLERVLVARNRAALNGGGLFITSQRRPSIATPPPVGARPEAGTVTVNVRNSTFSENDAGVLQPASGGAIYLEDLGEDHPDQWDNPLPVRRTLHLNHVTIVRNGARFYKGSAGGVHDAHGDRRTIDPATRRSISIGFSQTTASNLLIADNFLFEGAVPADRSMYLFRSNCNTHLSGNSFNIEDREDCFSPSSLLGTPDLTYAANINYNPTLDAQGVHLFTGRSVAIDYVSEDHCLSEDQRTSTRPLYGYSSTSRASAARCDAGAFEAGCGNGIVEDYLGEACDDGNRIDTDRCNNLCQPTPVCGNGVLETGESCDDGNLSNDDLCSDTCLIICRDPDGELCRVSVGENGGMGGGGTGGVSGNGGISGSSGAGGGGVSGMSGAGGGGMGGGGSSGQSGNGGIAGGPVGVGGGGAGGGGMGGGGSSGQSGNGGIAGGPIGVGGGGAGGVAGRAGASGGTSGQAGISGISGNGGVSGVSGRGGAGASGSGGTVGLGGSGGGGRGGSPTGPIPAESGDSGTGGASDDYYAQGGGGFSCALLPE